MRSAEIANNWVVRSVLLCGLVLNGCGQSTEDAGARLAAERFVASRNAYLAISKTALEEMIRVPVDVRREIGDTVAGVSIKANSVTTGRVGIELVPSALDAQFNTVIDAVTRIDISGAYKPRSDIRIDLSGLAEVSTLSLKPVFLDVDGVRGSPVVTKSESSLDVTKVNVSASGWMQWYKRMKAEQAVWDTIKKERPVQEKLIGERVVKEVNNAVEEQAGNTLLKFSNTFVRSVREWFVTSGFLPGKQVFQTSASTLWFSSLDPSVSVSGAAESLPPETAGAIVGDTEEAAPIVIGLSKSAMEHGLARLVAGKTYPLAAISQMLVVFGATEVPAVWNTLHFANIQATFADDTPVEFNLDQGVIRVVARFKSFANGAMRFPGASIALTYRVEVADDQNIGFILVQKPVVDSVVAKNPAATLSESHVLAEFNRQILEPGMKPEFSLPVPDLSKISASLAGLRLKLVRVEQGWVRVGTSLAALEK